jgi:carnitine-CoA ligase
MDLIPTGHESLFGVLARMAAARPESPFLVFEGDDGTEQRRTYAEMRDHALAAAASLHERRIGPGDRVHLHLDNCPEFLDCLFGAAALGALVVPTNPRLTPDELGFIVDHARCKLSVTTPERGDAVAAIQRDEVMMAGNLGKRAPVAPRVDPRDPAAILYTSGTTSRPKGVLVTHTNYLHVGNVVAGHLRIRRDDRWLVVLPLFHANAQYYSTMSALVSGASIALMSRFSASRWGSQAARHRATLASLFAAPIRMLLAHPEAPEEIDNPLRAVIFSQNVTEEQLDRFEARFRAPLLQLYGMTETIAPPTLNPLYGERRNLSIGLPTLGSRLRIVDAEGRRSTQGELLVCGVPGVSLMAGYVDDPVATAAVIKAGWLHTGDTVRVDADGYLYFVDRTKDMIKRAGENVAASEVEAVANRHPDVFESAAVGVPDEMRDEAIKLFVVRSRGSELTHDSLIAYCGERLADFKVPESVEFVESLPRTPVGKIRKDVLRQRERAK